MSVKVWQEEHATFLGKRSVPKQTENNTTCIFSVLEGLDTANKLTEIPKCSVAPLPVSPSTPNVRLSSRKIGTRYRLRNST